MAWSLEEALAFYRQQGAPEDQSALISLLKEIQREQGLQKSALLGVEAAYGLKESFLLAVIRRIPGLRLENTHCLELCGGPSCQKRADFDRFLLKTYGTDPPFEVKHTGCMHACAKGPNLRWDGVLYEGADEALIRRLTAEIEPK